MRPKIRDLADWAQALAAAGVLLGLVLVAYELRQTLALLELEARNQTYNNQFETRRTYLGENPTAVFAKACSKPESLALEDALVLEQALVLVYSQIRMAKEFSVRSGIGDSGWVPIASVEYNLMLRMEPAREWLKSTSQFLDPDIVKVAERYLPEDSQKCVELQGIRRNSGAGAQHEVEADKGTCHLAC